jgi:adenylate kinase
MKSMRLLTATLAVCVSLSFGEPLVNGPIVVLLGPPGSGKTLQAAAAAKYLNVPVVSVEELIESNAAELRRARTPGITGMEPQTDPVLNKFFEARLHKGDVARGMILDGYPNTKDHADFATKLVESGTISKPIILHLRISDDVVYKRLGGKQRKVSAAVEQRLKDYHRETVALKIYFPSAEIVEVDGKGKPAAVTKSIKAILKAKFGK